LQDPNQEYYFVVANNETVWGQTLEDTFNRPSGLADEYFYEMFEHFAARENIDVEHKLLGYIVLKGQKSVFDRMQTQHGPRFSYAKIDRASLNALLGALGEYMSQDYEPTAPPNEPIAFS